MLFPAVPVPQHFPTIFVCRLFHSIACYVEGFDEESRMLRRNLMRYMNLALILVLRYINSHHVAPRANILCVSDGAVVA
jgi:hypothetical protein